ncbi:MAG: sulfate ABC transporter permease subunit CysT [Deltaproteobacteria bacterium]|nr:sulfate ABC transporter permease subunit CysT [Deltaproteobacteria bacterium]
MVTRIQTKRALPGFGLSLGFTVLYLSLLVLIPLATIFLKVSTLSFGEFWQIATTPRVLAAYRLSFGASLAAAFINLFFGFLVAWVLVRYRFPCKRMADALIDLPFALPTAVAGISLTTVYSSNGWLGSWLERVGVKVAYTPLGICLALVFIGLPFVVRTMQPVLEELEPELEEAAACMGAGRGQIFFRVLLPGLWPSLLTGFSLAFARGLGEYGSIVFIAGNLPFSTEIVPLLIMTKLDQFDYKGATALALVMLLASFTLMLLINSLSHLAGKKSHRAEV